MILTHRFRVGVCLAALLAGCSMLSSCMSSPTYGTDKTAMEQLADDLGSSVSLSSLAPKNKTVSYQPRPALVMPAAASKETLVAPQQSLASKDNPQWVESPEETRARLVSEADENSASTTYRSPLAGSEASGRRLTAKEQQQAFRDARKLQDGAYIDQRRSLADPPTEYRDVADATQLEDLGEPEQKKEKRRKKEAAVAKTGSSWWMPFQ